MGDMMDNTAPSFILIADDDDVARAHMASILEGAGYKVLQAIDGGSARKVVNEHNISAAIIDHYMEPFGGLKFARDIRFDGFDVPLLLVTSEETSDLLLEATQAGFIGFLKKPVEPARLVKAAERMLRLVHLQKNASK